MAGTGKPAGERSTPHQRASLGMARDWLAQIARRMQV